MSRESIQSWCESIAVRQPHPGYCTGGSRFGPNCYDCSGFTYEAYRSDGKTIPADSSIVARWGRDNGQVHAVRSAVVSDLVVHDKYGDPYNSSGPRGHIGIFIHLSGDRVVTYESAGSGQGVGVYSRPADFWAISVCHPDFAGASAPTPAPPHTPEDEMFRVIKGDKAADLWLTNFLEKRKIGDPPEATAIINGGITNGAQPLTWPQAYVDRIPVAD